MDGLAASPAIAGENPEGAPADRAPVVLDLAYLPVPTDLDPYITTFFLARCDSRKIVDIQPAATGQLQIYLRGSGTMHFPAGHSDRSHPETLQAPTAAAARCEIDGPFHVLGMAIAPLGWAALTGIDAARGGNRLYDARAILGDAIGDVGDAIRALYDADPHTDGVALAALLADHVRTALRPLPPEHIALVQATTAWLGSGFNPPVEALYAATGYSPRQTQRLVARYFGSTPAHLIRKYRVTRVVALLQDPATTPEIAAGLVDQFFDQSHMIREVREFLGRTPGVFGDGASPLLEAQVATRNFYQIKPHVAPMPPLESRQSDA